MSTISHKAVLLAARAHHGVNRKDGNLPYLSHCMETMKVLYVCGVRQEEALAAAILHDTIEDAPEECRIWLQADIKALSEKVYNIVMELTFLGDGAIEKEKYLTSFKGKSIESYCIKIADRYSNINDFLREKPKYATKYAMKAQCLYTMFADRREEIVLCFGEPVAQRIDKLVTLCEGTYVSTK